MYISEIKTAPPEKFSSSLQEKIYSALSECGIKYERVDTDEAISMDDCTTIDSVLSVRTVKSLFLCSRSRKNFYLFITTADKPFKSKTFSSLLGISHTSFASQEDTLDILGTQFGAVSILALINDRERRVQTVIDKDVLKNTYFGCTDSTRTGYMKIFTKDITEKFLPFSATTV